MPYDIDNCQQALIDADHIEFVHVEPSLEASLKRFRNKYHKPTLLPCLLDVSNTITIKQQKPFNTETCVRSWLTYMSACEPEVASQILQYSKLLKNLFDLEKCALLIECNMTEKMIKQYLQVNTESMHSHVSLLKLYLLKTGRIYISK